jgi:hypothetical protein
MFTKPLCQLEFNGEHCVCPNCGNTVKATNPSTAYATCRFPNGRCAHLGEPVAGVTVQVRGQGSGGQVTLRTFALAGCKQFGWCVPQFQCTSINKQAVLEQWQLSNGGDTSKLGVCYGCHLYSPALGDSHAMELRDNNHPLPH